MSLKVKMEKFPRLPPLVPQRDAYKFTPVFFRSLYLAQGWKMLGEFPNLPKAVAIFSPHTSNFDAWYGFLTILGLNLQITSFAKHSLFETPLKPLLKWIGVTPIVRSTSQGYTQQVTQMIKQKEKIWIAITPEGTRKKAEKIKSGFYHIALEANIPIVMFALDYNHKAIQILGTFHPTGHYEQDLEKILQCYEGHFSPKNVAWLAEPLQKHFKNN